MKRFPEQQDWPTPAYEGPGRYEFHMESATRPAGLAFLAEDESQFSKRVWFSQRSMQVATEQFPGYSPDRVVWKFTAR